MTPMKSIWLFGTMILVEDMAGNVALKATCPNERDAEWLAASLSEYHKVPVERLEDRPYLTTLSVMVAK